MIREYGRKVYVLKSLIYVLLLIGAIVTIIPFYWSVVSSFKPMGEIFSSRQTLFPEHPTLRNFYVLLAGGVAWVYRAGGEEFTYAPVGEAFPKWFLNSAIVGGCYVLLGVFFCSIAGFGFAFYNFRGRDKLFYILMLSVSVPLFITVIPAFALMSRIGWVNTYWVLIVPASANAFGIFLIRQYLVSIPEDLLDSGRIDGCSEFQLYYKIALPLMKPALGALAIYLFIDSWNDFLWPLIMVRTQDMYTLPIGLSSLYGQFTAPFGLIMVGALLSSLPILFLFIAMHRYFVEGLTLGAVK